jgi:hypothetical protein
LQLRRWETWEKDKAAVTTMPESPIVINVFYADEARCAAWNAELLAENPNQSWRFKPGWYWRCPDLDEEEGGPFESEAECKADAADAAKAAFEQGYLELGDALKQHVYGLDPTPRPPRKH